MTFQDDNGDTLEFNGEFALTKRAVSVFDGNIMGDVSLNFKVKNNSVNRKFLNYTGPQSINQVAFTRQPVKRIKNGNILDYGYIIIQGESSSEIDCFYLSGNGNWMQFLKRLINDLDYTGITNGVDYRVVLNDTNINSLVSAESGVVFPLIDWCYNFLKTNEYFTGANLYDLSGNDENSFMDFYPCFYLKSLVTEIAKQTGIKISGDILEDGIYNTIAVTPNSNIKREYINLAKGNGSSLSLGAMGTNPVYNLFTTISDPESRFSSGSTYTANKKTLVRVTIQVVAFSLGPPGGANDLWYDLYRYSTVDGGSSEAFESFIAGGIRTGKKNTYEFIMNDGDYIQINADHDNPFGGATITLNWTIEIPHYIRMGDIANPSEFLPKLTCADIIKYLVNRFGCSCYYDFHNKTLSINLIENFKLEDAEDWSEYYISHSVDYTEVAASNFIKLRDVQDVNIKKYNDKNKVGFGEGNIEVENSIKEDNDVFSLPFGASFFEVSNNNIFGTSVPLVKLTDSGDPIAYTGIANDGSGNEVYNAGSNFFSGEVIRIQDNSRGNIGYVTVIDNPVPGSSVRVKNPYSSNFGGGYIYRQESRYSDTAPRELILKKSTSISDVSSLSAFYVSNDSFTYSSKTSLMFGYFTKIKTGKNIDKHKVNLAFDNPSIEAVEFNDAGFKDSRLSKVKTFFRNPKVNIVMRIPESVYTSFSFNKFVFIKTKELTGYFYVNSIGPFYDSTRPVEVTANMYG